MASFAIYLYLFGEYLRPGEVLDVLKGANVMDFLAAFAIINWVVYMAVRGGMPKLPQNGLLLGFVASILIGHSRFMRFEMGFTDMSEFAKTALYYFWMIR